jgi:hypothetical protein
MILFVNKLKIKWEWDNWIEKKNKSWLVANKMKNGEIEKKTIFF